MRILSSGDHHFDEHSHRFDECVRVHTWMVDVAREEGVDLFLSAGDLYERASTPREREAVAEWVRLMTEVCPVVIAKGNHDRAFELALLRRLRTRHPVIVEEAAGVHHVAGAAIGAMAWPETGYLAARLGSTEGTDVAVRDALQACLRWIGVELDAHDGPRVLLGHFMVDGSVVSTGQPLLGMPINIGLADLALARAHLGVMGHIHLAQRFDVFGAPHFYTGSPFRTDFGQLEKKTVLLAELDGPRLVSTREIETPATPMAHLEFRWTPDGLIGLNETSYQTLYAESKGAEVRLRYHVPVDSREAAHLDAERIASVLRMQGAALVKVEEVVITERRARAPEVALAETLPDKVQAFWTAKGWEPGERREALIAKARQLETEVVDAA
jgi:DNA repair exonuclease SbcCD nuclease subunit